MSGVTSPTYGALRSGAYGGLFLVVLNVLRRAEALRGNGPTTATTTPTICEVEEVVRTVVGLSTSGAVYSTVKGYFGQTAGAVASTVPLKLMLDSPGMRLNYKHLSAYLISKVLLQGCPLDRFPTVLLGGSLAGLLSMWLKGGLPEEVEGLLQKVSGLSDGEVARLRTVVADGGCVEEVRDLLVCGGGGGAKAVFFEVLKHYRRIMRPLTLFSCKVVLLRALYFAYLKRELPGVLNLFFDALRGGKYLAISSALSSASVALVSFVAPETRLGAPLVALCAAVGPALALRVETPQRRQDVATFVFAMCCYPMLARAGAFDAAMVASAGLCGAKVVSTPSLPLRSLWAENPLEMHLRTVRMQAAAEASKESAVAMSSGGTDAVAQVAMKRLGISVETIEARTRALRATVLQD